MARWLVLLTEFWLSLHLVVVRAEPAQQPTGQPLVGEFQQQRYLRGFDVPITSSGQFSVAADQTIVWHTRLPFETRLELSAERMTQYVGAEQLMQLPAARLAGMGVLRELLQISLQRDWQHLNRRFGIQPQFNGSSWHFELQPLQMTQGFGHALPFTEIAVQGELFVEQVRLQRGEGDYDLITFDQQRRLSAGQPLEPGSDNAPVPSDQP